MSFQIKQQSVIISLWFLHLLIEKISVYLHFLKSITIVFLKKCFDECLDHGRQFSFEKMGVYYQNITDNLYI